MVQAIRRGRSMRQVAREFDVSLSHVQRWVRRAGKERLERVDFTDRKNGPNVAANRTDARLETLVLAIRRHLKEESALGEFGAVAIHRELVRRRIRPKSLPTIRTIGRILERRGALDGRHRLRRQAGTFPEGRRSWTVSTSLKDYVWKAARRSKCSTWCRCMEDFRAPGPGQESSRRL